MIFANYKFFFSIHRSQGENSWITAYLPVTGNYQQTTYHWSIYILVITVYWIIYIYMVCLYDGIYIYIHMILDHYRSHLWHRAYWYRPVINIQISAGDVQVQPANGDVASLGQWTGWVEGLIQHSLLVPMGYIVNILYNSYYGTNIVNNSSYCNSMIYLLVIRTMVASIRSHGLFNLWFGGKKPSGKHTKSYGKSTQFLIGKSTISMGHFQ